MKSEILSGRGVINYDFSLIGTQLLEHVMRNEQNRHLFVLFPNIQQFILQRLPGNFIKGAKRFVH